MMRTTVLAIVVWTTMAATQSRPADIPFRTHPIDPGASETAAVVDVNRDGRPDIVSGEHWYEAPRRTERAGEARWTKHKFRELGFSNNYIDAFSDLPVDVDGDGFPDIVTVTWFDKKISWWRNPGHAPRSVAPVSRLWVEAVVNSGFNVEFAVLADVDNDGRVREIVAQENGTGQSWYEPRDGKWLKHVISDRTYGHGIGVGDVNGDKRNDILTPRGWLEAPADPRAASWTHHPAWEAANTPITPRESQAAPQAGSPPRIAELGFIHVMDVNGDGRNDVITAAGEGAVKEYVGTGPYRFAEHKADRSDRDFVGDVADHELHPVLGQPRQRLLGGGVGQLVQHRDGRIRVVEYIPDEVRADETRPAGHQKVRHASHPKES